MPYQLRKLTIDDYENIVQLWADAGLPYRPQGRDSREMMAREMQLPVVAFFGLFDRVKMIGVGIANYDGRRGWVNRVAIDPDYRGQRLAGRLIRQCEQFLRDAGAVVICALIEEENTPSMACFGKEGFVAEPTITYWTKRRSELD